ncbi:unnamed protein product [Trichobilharzia regenti]|nr:unnamed protein product [Trichobilharzia regenti]
MQKVLKVVEQEAASDTVKENDIHMKSAPSSPEISWGVTN